MNGGGVTKNRGPGTASGVIFVTLEDETGNINVIVWNDVLLKYRRELLGARLLGVQGSMQREGDVFTSWRGSLWTTAKC